MVSGFQPVVILFLGCAPAVRYDIVVQGPDGESSCSPSKKGGGKERRGEERREGKKEEKNGGERQGQTDRPAEKAPGIPKKKDPVRNETRLLQSWLPGVCSILLSSAS